jgi:hypothetical protein
MKRISALIIAIVLLTVMVSDTWGAEKTLVYVAGNPNLYPICLYLLQPSMYLSLLLFQLYLFLLPSILLLS